MTRGDLINRLIEANGYQSYLENKGYLLGLISLEEFLRDHLVAIVE